MSFDEGAAAESWAHLPLDKDCVPVLPGQSCMSKVKHDLDLKAKAGTRGTDNPKYPWRTYEQYHDRHGKQHHEQPLRTELKWEQRLGQLGTAIRQIEKMSSPQGLVPAAVPKPSAEVDELKAQYDSMKKLIEDPDHQFKHTFGCPVSHYPAKQHYDTAKYPEPPPDIYANPSGPPPARPVFPPSLRVKNQEEIAQLSTAGSFAPGASVYGPGSMFEHGSGRGGWSSERQYVDQHRERRGGSYDAAIEYTPLPSEACLSRDAWVCAARDWDINLDISKHFQGKAPSNFRWEKHAKVKGTVTVGDDVLTNGRWHKYQWNGNKEAWVDQHELSGVAVRDQLMRKVERKRAENNRIRYKNELLMQSLTMSHLELEKYSNQLARVQGMELTTDLPISTTQLELQEFPVHMEFEH